ATEGNSECSGVNLPRRSQRCRDHRGAVLQAAGRYKPRREHSSKRSKQAINRGDSEFHLSACLVWRSLLVGANEITGPICISAKFGTPGKSSNSANALGS